MILRHDVITWVIVTSLSEHFSSHSMFAYMIRYTMRSKNWIILSTRLHRHHWIRNSYHDLGYCSCTMLCTDCPKKNYNRHLGFDCERTLMKSEKSNRIIKLLLFFYNWVKTPFDLAKQSQRNMEFCKGSHISLSSEFCHWNVCGFHGQIVFTKDRLANIFKFYA